MDSLRTLYLGTRSYLGHLVRDYQKHLAVTRWRQRGVDVAWQAAIYSESDSQLIIGKGTTIGPYTVLNLISDPQSKQKCPSVLEIGENTAINEFNNIRAGNCLIRIGSNCLISQYVSIIGMNHTIDGINVPIREAPWDSSRTGVTIGDDVWIGVGATILPGINVGNGAVIGAGSVVVDAVPSNAIVVGTPARVIRSRLRK